MSSSVGWMRQSSTVVQVRPSERRIEPPVTSLARRFRSYGTRPEGESRTVVRFVLRWPVQI